MSGDKIGIGGFFHFGGFGSDHINRADLVRLAARRAKRRFQLADDTRAFHIGDARQDMTAAREGGATPIGVTTGVFTAAELKAAGAHEVVSDLADSDQLIDLFTA